MRFEPVLCGWILDRIIEWVLFVGSRPKTLTEYKQSKPKEYVELGSLGADLDRDDLVEKRANRARIKHFSSQLRQINKEVGVVVCPFGHGFVPFTDEVAAGERSREGTFSSSTSPRS
jgi:hypothetical protein